MGKRFRRAQGGFGDDIYIIAEASDTITELEFEGTDTVQSAVTLTLGAHVENILLTGSATINATGNDSANQIVGNSAANALTGGLGADSLFGLAGADALSGGNDNDALDGGDGDDTLIGASGQDSLVGGLGLDVLDGGADADVLQGGAGSDLYFYASGAGFDTLNEAGTAADVDTLRLTGHSPTSVQLIRAGNDLRVRLLASGEELAVVGHFSRCGQCNRAHRVWVRGRMERGSDCKRCGGPDPWHIRQRHHLRLGKCRLHGRWRRRRQLLSQSRRRRRGRASRWRDRLR